MRRAVPFLLFSACGLMVITAGCRAKEPGTETASRSTSDSMAAPAERGDKIAITTASDEARTLYTRGRELADQLRAHDARKLFEQAAAKDPNFALAHYDLATNSPTPKEFLEHLNEAVALSGKASEGERLRSWRFRPAATANPRSRWSTPRSSWPSIRDDERAPSLLGFACSGQQEFDKAIGTAHEGDRGQPDSLHRPTIPSATPTCRRRKYAEAEPAFKKYIELIPNDPNPYDSYAELLMQTGRFDESIAQYRKALSLEPHFSNSYIGIATNLMFQGKHARRRPRRSSTTGRARRWRPAHRAFANRAVIFLDQGNTDAGAPGDRRSSTPSTPSWRPRRHERRRPPMGDILLDAGRADEAAKRYQQSLKLIEGSGLPGELKKNAKLGDHYNLARVALAKRDLATAKSEAAAYMSGAEATGDIARIRLGHELAGTIALQEKDFDQATEHLAQADQQDPYILYTIALAYQGKGDAAKAKEFAQRAADQHTLPTIRYALVRMKASKIG